jgi:hypothetical protein
LLASKGSCPKADERDGDHRYRETDESNEHVASNLQVHENVIPISGRAGARATLDPKQIIPRLEKLS